MTHDASKRHMLIVSHTYRPEAIVATNEVVTALLDAGVVPVFCEEDYTDFSTHVDMTRAAVLGTDVPLSDVEVAFVLGGDGTILRAAEVLRGSACPIMGVNLGHVGFLAEMESLDLGFTVEQVLAGNYTVDERLALEVLAEHDGQIIADTWALNEASVEKGRRMLEVSVGIDDHPISIFACDGVVLSTPTGSTAYGFSAGGPIVWPSVQALLVVPIAAHALFNRPLVAGPDSELTVQILPENIGPAVLWCDGRRRTELPAGSKVTVRRSHEPVRIARLDDAPFSERLVRKFNLPVSGWRGDRGKGVA
ncbi:NAD kinase [Leucobacter denitrificans]|uniref:NAD kinase n=1 Tax=Leucobacter denitrificans TaxID=683042 RepID=A0A7G9S463_9MICO|nr:NAD kinase [Leucobacter denitrificans]QNN62638.1 NAD kinase [Leucobacter denitrificans]